MRCHHASSLLIEQLFLVHRKGLTSSIIVVSVMEYNKTLRGKPPIHLLPVLVPGTSNTFDDDELMCDCTVFSTRAGARNFRIICIIIQLQSVSV